MWGVAVGILSAVSVVWWVFGRLLVSKILAGDVSSFLLIPEDVRNLRSPEDLFLMLGVALTLMPILAAGAYASCRWNYELRERLDGHAYLIRSIAGIFAGSVICTASLLRQGFDAPWSPIEQSLSLTAEPPFLHRVLFVYVARIAMQIAGLSIFHAYVFSQLVAIVLAMIAIWKLSELFVDRKWTCLAPGLLALMFMPTLTYYTFYDIGIVFFYTAGLIALFQRRRVVYLGLICAGVLNHENILLLIFLSGVIYFREKGWLAFLGTQLVLYAAVRSVLFYFLPVSRAWSYGKIWVNLNFLFFRPQNLVATSVLFLWFAIAFYVDRTAAQPSRLQRCYVLLPMLVAVTLVVGQVNEARQFDAFLPIAVVMLLRGFGVRPSLPSTTA